MSSGFLLLRCCNTRHLASRPSFRVGQHHADLSAIALVRRCAHLRASFSAKLSASAAVAWNLPVTYEQLVLRLYLCYLAVEIITSTRTRQMSGAGAKAPAKRIRGWRAAINPVLFATIGYLLVAVHVNSKVSPYVVTSAQTLGVLSRSEWAGPYGMNDALARPGAVQHVSRGAVQRQETTTLDHATGDVYAFSADGWLLRVGAAQLAAIDATGASPEALQPQRVCYVGGRILSGIFSPHAQQQGQRVIIAADALRGLVSVDIDTCALKLLASTVADADAATGESRDIPFADDLDICSSDAAGTVYFSDASDIAPWRNGLTGVVNVGEVSMLDLYRGEARGRLLAYHPATGNVTTLLRGIHFANGVALSADCSFVVLAETFGARLHRLWLTGPRAGSHDIFADLPCVPDGVSRSRDGTAFWVACPTPVTYLMALAASSPVMRYVVGSLPSFMWPPLHQSGTVLKVEASTGAPLLALHDEHGTAVTFITAVTESDDGYLYLGQLYGNSIPRVRVP